MGHEVTGVDVSELPGVADRTSTFVQADLSEGIPPEVGGDFDVVLAADVLEHLVDPGSLMMQIRDVMSPEGIGIFCVPNIAHWYPRVRSALGMFGYDQRGILDSTHLRFFTRKSIRRLIERHGFQIRRIETVGLPFDAFTTESSRPRWLGIVDHFLLALWPTMFGYQFIIEVTPRPE
jgi:2-polyprenyl-3-methyl-5-hydroxy-6-metoxy-1,4-benzoquinol methylase